MKFLAFALLLAVGSQAASLQADAPSQLQHARSVVDAFLLQVKDGTNRALDKLDGTPYAEQKAFISDHLEIFHKQLKTAQQSVAPFTDSVVSTLADATDEVRTSISNDFEVLKAELEPKVTQLRTVLDKHYEDYRTQMQPIITEYMEKHNAEMEEMRAKMEPVMEELRAKVKANIEETKSVLVPIVEAVRGKIAERLMSLKEMVTPYVSEYKEQITQAYDQAQSMNTDQLEKLKAELGPLAEEVKIKLNTMFQLISATFIKN